MKIDFEKVKIGDYIEHNNGAGTRIDKVLARPHLGAGGFVMVEMAGQGAPILLENIDEHFPKAKYPEYQL